MMLCKITDAQVREYHAQGLFDEAAAAILRVSPDTFGRRRRKLGLARNFTLPVIDIDLLRKLVANGDSDKAISKIMGVAPTTICHHRANLGIHSGDKRGCRRGEKRNRNADHVGSAEAASRRAQIEANNADWRIKELLAGQRFEDDPRIRPGVGPLPRAIPHRIASGSFCGSSMLHTSGSNGTRISSGIGR